ncbi:hypothetical protein FHS18_005562 [Paenibacillus phyllosphaerae]|uniref:Uncharacterized protein n=1 Tax=Paenibacillus phyllosphaerae TaxID=274593 RepID=A0A7W5B2X1_9BACL|nr:hypothetical protein [Paenibacillus phyllosphaerae]MBB3113450.1 hypothetical protein [Paenibacillus phyllosphaerae]
MIRDIRYTYMSNGTIDVRWDDGRVRTVGVINKEEFGLFKIAFNYFLYETPFNTLRLEQIERIIENGFKLQLASKLKMDLKDEAFTRIHAQVERVAYKIGRREFEHLTIEEELGLQEQKSDYQILLAARTGAGKSTIIKSCSSLPDNVNFPVINANRTTTFPTEYVLSNDLTYDFKIVFHDKEWIIPRVQDALAAFIKKYISLKCGQGLVSDGLLEECVEAFNNADEQNIFIIRHVLGQYKIDAKSSLDIELNAFWNTLYAMIEDWYMNVTRKEEVTSISTRDFLIEYMHQKLENDLDSNTNPLNSKGKIISMIYEYIQKRVYNILKEAETTRAKQTTIGGSPGFGIIENSNTIKGYHGVYSLQEAWNMLRFFFSRDSSDIGKSITPLVKRAKVKVPYNQEFNGKYATVSLHDIVGYGHSNSDTGSLEGSILINYSHFDVIAVIERSDDPMNEVTKKILKNLLDTALKKKILICYSHYHRLNKDDWSEETYEQEREHELIKLQEQALRKMNTDQHDISELNALRTMFLRYDVYEEGARRKTRVIKNRKDAEEFVSKVVSVAESVHEAQLEKPIELRYDASIINTVYQKAREDFLRIQKEVYDDARPPHYAITKALTKRLWYKETHYGNSNMILKPLDDFHMCFMTHFNDFLSQSILVTQLDDEASLLILDHIKEKVAQDLKDEVRMVFLNTIPADIEPQKYIWDNEWEECFSFSGQKSDVKRRARILEIFERIVPKVEMNKKAYWVHFLERQLKALNVIKNY